MKAITILCLLIGALACTQKHQELDPAAIQTNNRGVGLMGYFDYEGAREVFQELATAHPNWLEVRVNLAIATLNRQQDGDEAAALAIADEVLAIDPDHLRARYVRGLLLLNAGDAEGALAAFEQVSKSDPTDAYAAYYAALCQSQLGKLEPSLQRYEQALTLDPYLRSAYYGAFQVHRRLRNQESAKEYLEIFTRLEANPRARLAEFKYTRMGPKGDAEVVDLPGEMLATKPQGPLFSEALNLIQSNSSISSATGVDIDADGDVDVFLSSTVANSILLNQGNGEFVVAENHPLQDSTALAALWGDIDNDGAVDVYLLRQTSNQLWMQTENGWEDVTFAAGVGGGDVKTLDGQLFDADHDGDLDIFVVNENAPNELFNNNLNGTFRTLGGDYGLGGSAAPKGQVLAYDIDSDRDLDILVLKGKQQHELYVNDRLWRYRPADSNPGNPWGDFLSTPALAAVVGDVNADGAAEIYTLTPNAKILRWESVDSTWVSSALVTLGSVTENAQLALLDVSGNGIQELLLSEDEGFGVLSLSDIETGIVSNSGQISYWSPLILDSQTGPSIVSVTKDNIVQLWSPGTGRHNFMAMTFTGQEEAADSMRSNASGIGTQVHVRSGSDWTALTTLRQWSGPGQSLQPLAVGLGGARKIDYAAMTWSDGVFQTELGLVTDQLHRISETQRQLSSCPVLFAWNGEEWGFLSDVLGVGGIGFNVGKGKYTTPRPWEKFLIPEGHVAPRAGKIAIKITEPMEEIAYIDSARLVVIDVPEDWQMVLDERMATGEPQVTGEALFYRQEILPDKAYNERKLDVLNDLRHADKKAAPIPQKDRRFVGRLAKEHILTLEFTEPLPDSDLVLMADGWVEYPYSQTGFAAWQAGASFDPPTLEARSKNGQWQTVAEKFGYPAGMPRRMALPLVSLPKHTQALRLRTNLEVYWDRISVISPEPNALVKRQVLPVDEARVSYIGFPTRHDGDQRQPAYDYDRRTPLWDTRYPKGYYTAFGDAKPLVASTDNNLAIIGPGEEIHLDFIAPKPPTEGWRRYYVFETEGWAKDMDMYTDSGGTVGPLPHNEKLTPTQTALNARYNTRFRVGR